MWEWPGARAGTEREDTGIKASRPSALSIRALLFKHLLYDIAAHFFLVTVN